MKQFMNSRLLQSILFVAVVFITSTQVGYSQTALEFSSKAEQEKTKIIEGVLQKAFDHLASASDLDGVKKTQEGLIRHRRISNLLRALFDKSAKAE